MVLKELGALAIVFYTFPIVALLLIATTLLRHDQKLMSEIRHYSDMKYQIELFSGLLEASQHAAANFKDAQKSDSYTEETFTLIRNKLLEYTIKADKYEAENSANNSSEDSNNMLDMATKIISLSQQKGG